MIEYHEHSSAKINIGRGRGCPLNHTKEKDYSVNCNEGYRKSIPRCSWRHTPSLSIINEVEAKVHKDV